MVSKNALLAVHDVKVINIGDYIQALASKQFFDKVDCFIEREKLAKYNDIPAKIIMNGWFMHKPEKWPPSKNINPLFVAFHINSLAKEILLNDLSISYLKKNEPIGCRDHYTKNLLLSKGIDAYFSGCMTLTLGYSYRSNQKDGKYYFVDAYFSFKKTSLTVLATAFNLLFRYKTIKKITQAKEEKKSLKNLFLNSAWHVEYSKIFSDNILENAIFIRQQDSQSYPLERTNEELLSIAEDLIKKYAKASLIVTSRIHCALPCLGLDTPVIYIEDQEQSEASSCRLDGLRQLFNIIPFKNGHLDKKNSFIHLKKDEKITTKTKIKNKSDHKILSEQLIKTCHSFMSQK